MKQALYNLENTRRIAMMTVNEINKLNCEDKDFIVKLIVDAIPKLAKLSVDDFNQFLSESNKETEDNKKINESD